MGTDDQRLTGTPTRYQTELDDAYLECELWRHHCGSLKSDVADAKVTIASLTEALADSVWQNTWLASIADFRLRHNDAMFAALTQAAIRTIQPPPQKRPRPMPRQQPPRTPGTPSDGATCH